MTIKRIPTTCAKAPLAIYETSAARCETVKGRPVVYVDGLAYKPDLYIWARFSKTVRDALERRGISSLSELTEERDKTLRSVAWDDMQRYINGGE